MALPAIATTRSSPTTTPATTSRRSTTTRRVIASDPAAFSGYYRWDVYYNTTSGDVLLPIGYAETERIPVADYLATHPQ